MSLVNKTRRDANSRHQQAHSLMQQAVSLNSILQSPEYLNCLTLDKNYVNTIAQNILKDFNVAVANLKQLDATLGAYNQKQLFAYDHADLLNLDQQYVAWCENFSQIITPAICTLVEYIQSHFGAVGNV